MTKQQSAGAGSQDLAPGIPGDALVPPIAGQEVTQASYRVYCWQRPGDRPAQAGPPGVADRRCRRQRGCLR
jgi:hypothetical protein